MPRLSWAAIVLCVGCSTQQSEEPEPTGPYAKQDDVSTGQTPSSLALADFDADGALDLAVTNLDDDTLQIYRGRGGGRFDAHVALATGDEPRSLTTGDFDRDGLPDVAVANRLGDTASVYLNQGGANFAPALELATGIRPMHLASADLDGDSDDDLVIANADAESISVFLADGQGAFDAGTEFPGGTNPVELELVDLDGDGALDVVTATRVVPPTVSVMLGDGQGAFGAVTKYKASNRPGLVFPIAPATITSGDVDGDGDKDVLVGNRGLDVLDGEAWTLAGDGTGTLAEPADVPGFTVLAPAFIDLVDLDGDGLLDLIDADHDPTIATIVGSLGGAAYSICLAAGDGTGSFEHTTCLATGDFPYQVATGHLNDDEKLDLVTVDSGSDRLSVYLAR
jgi:hypothetical protein